MAIYRNNVVCMYGHTYSKSMDQPGTVANPARGQLNGKIDIFLSPFAPENLASQDGFDTPVPRQPAHLHTQAEYGAYLRDSSRVLRRHPLFKECFYDSPPPNRRLHEPENKEYSPLQAAKILKNKMRDRLVFTITSTCEQIGPAIKIIMLEKRRGIGFETVAGMGGGYHRRNTLNRHTPSRQSRVDRVTQLRTDGVHCREFAGTGPVNLKVVPNGCCLGRSPWTN